MADLRVMTTTGEEMILEEATVQQFKGSLRGALLCPGNDGYDAARQVFNAMVDKRPALIVRCAGAADVVTAVHFAREHNVCVAVGLDHGIGHFMLFEVDAKVQAPVPLRPKSPQTSSAASDRKSAPLPWCRQVG